MVLFGGLLDWFGFCCYVACVVLVLRLGFALCCVLGLRLGFDWLLLGYLCWKFSWISRLGVLL